MNALRWTRPLAAAAMALSVAACGGGSDDAGEAGGPGMPGANGQVPASAAASPSALLQFLKGLAKTEVDEPLQLGAFEPPQADFAEPETLD